MKPPRDVLPYERPGNPRRGMPLLDWIAAAVLIALIAAIVAAWIWLTTKFEMPVPH